MRTDRASFGGVGGFIGLLTAVAGLLAAAVIALGSPATAAAASTLESQGVFYGPLPWTWEAEMLPVEPNAYEPEVSADEEFVAWSMWDTVLLFDLQSRETSTIYSGGARVYSPPKVSSPTVVWKTGGRFDPGRVWVYDLYGGETTALPHSAHSFDVYHGYVVWAGEDGVYLFENYTGDITPISDDEMVEQVRIFGRHVVWEARTDGGDPQDADWDSREIFLYDLDSKETRRLTDNAVFDGNPDLSDAYVVWEGGPEADESSHEIFCYGIYSRQTTQLTVDDASDALPRIYRETVVWTKDPDLLTDGVGIFVHDLRAQRTTQITAGGGSRPTPVISEGLIAWGANAAVDPAVGNDVFVYDLSSESTAQIARWSADEPMPAISGDRVFWMEWVDDGYGLLMAEHTWNMPDVVEFETPYWWAIQALAGRDIMHGYPDGTFHPDRPVTRQQFAKMLAKATNLPVSMADVCPFPDVSKGLDWSDALYPDRYIGAAAKAGLIFGYADGRFRPTSGVSRAQAVSMVVRAAQKLYPGLLQTPLSGYRSDWGDFDPTHAANARRAEYNGLLWLEFLEDLDPFAPMTRGEVANVLYEYVELARRGPVPSPGPAGPTAAQIGAAILGDQPQIPPELFILQDYRVSGDWAAALILWKHYEGAKVVLRRIDGAWTVFLLGTGATPEDYAGKGLPGELIQFLW